MKTFASLVLIFVCLNISLSAQKNKTILVRAGSKIQDYFPYNVRYRYPDFIPGKVIFKYGAPANILFNYNILYGEIEFIQAGDTVAFSKKKDVRYIAAQDTFYYDNGYIEVISGGQPVVGLKQYVRIKDILKKGAYGTTNRSGSIDTYDSMSARGISYGLIPDEDMELELTQEYYISLASAGFVPFTKKNVLQLFPDHADKLKSYLKSEKINFNTSSDLLKLAGYLQSL